MRSTFFASLLVFILIEGSKPVVGGGKKLKQLQARVKALEECQPCSVIEELLVRVKALENRTPPECQNYQVLADASRNVNHGANPLLCDNHLTPNWYRFQGAAGVKMLSSCPQTSRCGTHATGWLSGDHPSVEEGKVTRKVCFSWSNCCTWSIDIKVMNCGDFYIYYIDGTPREHQFHLRYCGTA
ncbi:pancreatic secretory granule membrane major glycoprotein GP2 isoform X4 [Pocillopora verrucosa]|uniref:pancreatic secretory granule membrane major glycoprotein GP2 isoform X4 n=1 Tax=Pocillopora verrucosa TaxID=203993 RepID=UPI00333EA9D0